MKVPGWSCWGSLGAQGLMGVAGPQGTDDSQKDGDRVMKHPHRSILLITSLKGCWQQCLHAHKLIEVPNCWGHGTAVSPQLPESSAKGIMSRAAGRAVSFPRCPPLLTPSREGSEQGGEAQPYSKGRVTLSWGMIIPNFPPWAVASRTRPSLCSAAPVHVKKMDRVGRRGPTRSKPLTPVAFQVAELPAKEDAESCRTLLLLPERNHSFTPGVSIWRLGGRRAAGVCHVCSTRCRPLILAAKDAAPSHRRLCPLPADGLSLGQRDRAVLLPPINILCLRLSQV